MSEALRISLSRSLSEMSPIIEEVGFETDPDSSSQERLYVAWTSAPQPAPGTRVDEQDDAPQEPVNIDVVVVFGLFDVPQARHKPLGWLCEHLDRPGGDSRILHFNYRPSEVVAPGEGYYGIHTLSELLLCQLTALRARDTNRRLIFLAFDMGCIIVKKALTIASQTKSPHGQIFDMCRILAFFDCPHRYTGASDLEDKLARLFYGRAGNYPSHIRPTPHLADSILIINESFVASKFLVRGYLISIHEDSRLGSRAWQMLENHMGVLGTPFEWNIFCPRINDFFVPDLLRVLSGLQHLPATPSEASLDIPFPRLPFDGERALFSLATPTEPFITAGHIRAPIKLHDAYSKWLDSLGPRVLYAYSSTDDNDLVRRTSEHVFNHLADIQAPTDRLLLMLYYSFDASDIRSRSLSNMLWTLLAHITSRFVEIRHFVPFMLNRLYAEQACSETDLLGWFGFFIARFDDIRVVINHFDVCPKASRDVFLQLVRRIAMENDRPLQIFITSEKPSSLEAEMSGWPSIDMGTDNTPLGTGAEVEPKGDTQEQEPDLVSQPPTVYSIRGTMKLLSKLPEGAGAADALAMSILAEQQLKRSLTIQEILQEATYGPLETYSLEAVVDRILRGIPNQKQTRLAVAFLLFATRPLSTKESATIMFLGSLVDDGDSISPHRDLFDRLERQRSAWFAGITVNKHSGIRLAHPRVESILRNPEAPGSPSYFWHEVASTAHYDIANACLEYLTRTNVKKEQDLLSDESFIVDGDLGFTSYAVKYWPHHFSLAQATTKEEAIGSLRQKLSNIDLERWSRTIWLLSNPFSRSRNPFNSPIPALISLGHPNILEPSSPSDIALGAEEAARAGNANLVGDLLEAGGKDQLPQSALLEIITAASSSGDESLIIDLIDRLSAEGRDELSKRGKALLFRAARLGLARLEEKLLEMGTPVDPTIPYSKDTFTTPFCVAVSAGHTPTVKVLLNHGANANFRSHLQRTPLSLAASRGNADMIECLVKQGKADIEHLDTGSDSRGQTPLFIACEWGNLLAVKKLIDLGVDPSKPDDKEWTPIIVAATFGHWRTIQTLLDYDVDIETPGPKGNGTALRYVLANGHTEVFRRLLERGADPSSARFRVPLLFEIAGRGLPVPDESRVPLAKLLLEHNVDINATSERGRTGLSRACAQRQSELAEFLLGAHADVNLADRDGYTALYEAARTGNVALVKMLLDRGADANAVTARGALSLHACSDAPELTRLLAARTENIDLPTPKGFTALMFAASKGWTASVKALLEHNANIDAAVTKEGQWAGWTALMFAAFSQSADTVRVLADAGADLKRVDAHGNSAAHLIYRSRDLDERAGLASLNVLLEFRALDVDQAGEAGDAVLHRCAQLGHLQAVQRLVRAGASLNLLDNFGSTPLGEAVWGRKREVVSYLLERGADPNKAGRDVGHREGPLLRACRDGDYAVAKMLVEHGADVNCDSVSGFGTPLMAACLPYSGHGEDTDKLALYLLSLGVDINAKSHYIGSPLAAAALSARAGIVRALLDKGARCDIKDDLGRKAVHFAALNGEANFRLIAGVDPGVSEVDVLGRSVLHYAAQGGRVRVIRRLIDAFPTLDIDARDVDGWTALCWAARGSASWAPEDRASEQADAAGVIRLLVSRGADRSAECRIGEEMWTPIRIAEYAGAADEVIALLKPEPGRADERRRGRVIKGVTCDACLWEIRGIYYLCKACYDYALCAKCWPHRDLVHVFEARHDFEAVDEE